MIQDKDDVVANQEEPRPDSQKDNGQEEHIHKSATEEEEEDKAPEINVGSMQSAEESKSQQLENRNENDDAENDEPDETIPVQ